MKLTDMESNGELMKDAPFLKTLAEIKEEAPVSTVNANAGTTAALPGIFQSSTQEKPTELRATNQSEQARTSSNHPGITAK